MLCSGFPCCLQLPLCSFGSAGLGSLAASNPGTAMAAERGNGFRKLLGRPPDSASSTTCEQLMREGRVRVKRRCGPQLGDRPIPRLDRVRSRDNQPLPKSGWQPHRSAQQASPGVCAAAMTPKAAQPFWTFAAQGKLTEQDRTPPIGRLNAHSRGALAAQPIRKRSHPAQPIPVIPTARDLPTSACVGHPTGLAWIVGAKGSHDGQRPRPVAPFVS